MRLVLLLLLAYCACVPNAWARGLKRALEDVPNPMIDPLSCGRANVPRSALCDPDRLLTKDKQDELEGYMNAFTLADAAVVVIKQMDLNSVRAPDVDLAAERYARGLHDRYGVGNKDTQNGVLIFLSIDDRAVYISTGKGLSEKLHKIMIDFVIDHMKPELRKGDYGGALATCLTNIDVILSGKDEAMIAKAYKHHRASKRSDDDNDTFSLLVWLAVFGGFLGWAFWRSAAERRRIQNLDQGRLKLEKLLKEMENSHGNQNKFEASSCPICLEDFDAIKVPTSAANNLRTALGGDLSGGTSEVTAVPLEITSIDTTPAPRSTVEEEGSPMDDDIPAPPKSTTIASKTVSLRCGHVFCLGCMEEYLKSDQHNRCPICRKNITGDDHQNHSAAGDGGRGSGFFGTRPNEGSQARQRRVPGTSGSSLNDGTEAAPSNARNDNSDRRNGLFSRFGRRNVDPYNYDGYIQGQSGQALNNNGGTGTVTATMTENPEPVVPRTPGMDNPEQQQYPQQPPPPPLNNMQYNNYDPYYNNPFGYSSRRFRYHAPEWRFRLHRMHYMYPSVVDYEVLRTANAAIDRGNLGDLHNQLTARGAQIRLQAEQLRTQMEARARASGSSGSSRGSFGGGSSSGGGGGRW